MSFIRKLIVTACFLTSSLGTAVAGTVIADDYQLNQDRMITTPSNIMIASSFADTDHISAYNEYGIRLWDVAFYPKILSWKLKDGRLYVFSRSRLSESTYLTCMDPNTGFIIWERP